MSELIIFGSHSRNNQHPARGRHPSLHIVVFPRQGENLHPARGRKLILNAERCIDFPRQSTHRKGTVTLQATAQSPESIGETTYTPQGDGNLYQLFIHRHRLRETIYTPQGDGDSNKPMLAIIACFETIYTPQGDGNQGNPPEIMSTVRKGNTYPARGRILLKLKSVAKVINRDSQHPARGR